MERKEQVFIGVAFVALVALVIMDLRAKNAAAQSASAQSQPVNNPMAAATVEGPQYLTYNQPWMFSPPVGNIMPTQTTGQVGQIAGQSPNPMSGTAVNTCSTCG